MGRSTLGRDYDIGRTLEDFRRRIAALERAALLLRYLFTPGVVYDTGWVAVPADTGFTSALEVRRIAHRVMLRGTLSPSVDWGAANSLQQPVAAGGVPLEFRTPLTLATLGASGATSAANLFKVSVQSNGGIQVRCNTAAHTNSVSVNFTYLDN